MLILGIETTCDESACAIVRDGREILSNAVASQADLHEIYGGVVPELACRRHIDTLIPIIKEALEVANTTLQEIDLIAVAKGPGLIGALLIGLNTAKALAFSLDKPFIGINHIEAHIYAATMCHPEETLEFPCLGVVISGGHTSLVKIHALGEYELLAQTVDDAIGEAFDKVAAMLGFHYPGGPIIEKLAKKGDPLRFPFKAGRVKSNPLNFSFSGLKTNVLYTIKGPNSNKHSPCIIAEEEKKDVAASFQYTACQDLVKKTLQAARSFPCKGIFFGGGVSNNRYLRQLFEDSEIPCYWPTAELSLDNAAMIAGLAYHTYKKNPQGDALDLEASTRLPFASTL